MPTLLKKLANPGLVHGRRHVEVEDVKNVHHTKCKGCGKRPKGRRLQIVYGSGRSQLVVTLCDVCGNRWLAGRVIEMEAAQRRLCGDNVSVRVKTDPMSVRPPKKKKDKKDETATDIDVVDHRRDPVPAPASPRR